MAIEEEPRPGARTRGLHSNVEFQPRKPPIWPWFFVSNHRRYGHEWATMLWPLRTYALRLNLWWYTQPAVIMCMSLRAWGRWWCTVPISLYVVSECHASWCVTCTSLLTTQLEESGDWRKKTWTGTGTRGLRSNVEFQPCEPPIWPRFFVSNRCRINPLAFSASI